MFNKNTEYAVVILNELKKSLEAGKPTCRLEAVATTAKLKIGFAEQISRKLRKGELIRSTRGPGGGYNITEKGLNINLWELMEVVEPALQSKTNKLLPATKNLYGECAEKMKGVYIFS